MADFQTIAKNNKLVNGIGYVLARDVIRLSGVIDDEAIGNLLTDFGHRYPGVLKKNGANRLIIGLADLDHLEAYCRDERALGRAEGGLIKSKILSKNGVRVAFEEEIDGEVVRISTFSGVKSVLKGALLENSALMSTLEELKGKLEETEKRLENALLVQDRLEREIEALSIKSFKPVKRQGFLSGLFRSRGAA